MRPDTFDPNVDSPDEPPPTYEEAVTGQDSGQLDVEGADNQSYQAPAAPPPTRPSHPPPQPARPAQPPQQAQPVQDSTSDIYTANLDLPFRYPKGYYCKKCHNTGYRKHKKCKYCWSIFGPQPTKPAKPAKPAKHSSSTFPGTHHSGSASTTGTYTASSQHYTSQYPMQNAVPVVAPPNGAIVLQPGDPRIGGQLCQRCKGRGQVHFFLDMETCPQCNGLGRIR